MTLKHNTRIEVRGWDMAFNETWETARIRNLKRDMKRWGSLDDVAGYHRVTFADGGVLCVHETSFRVVDNQ